MKNVVLVAFVAVIGWQAYSRYQDYRAGNFDAPDSEASPWLSPGEFHSNRDSSASFRCDGRIYCSQMTSCAEATYFLMHCPGVKMDGNNDGVPCERQWCR